MWPRSKGFKEKLEYNIQQGHSTTENQAEGGSLIQSLRKEKLLEVGL